MGEISTRVMSMKFMRPQANEEEKEKPSKPVHKDESEWVLPQSAQGKIKPRKRKFESIGYTSLNMYINSEEFQSVPIKRAWGETKDADDDKDKEENDDTSDKKRKDDFKKSERKKSKPNKK